MLRGSGSCWGDGQLGRRKLKGRCRSLVRMGGHWDILAWVVARRPALFLPNSAQPWRSDSEAASAQPRRHAQGAPSFCCWVSRAVLCGVRARRLRFSLLRMFYGHCTPSKEQSAPLAGKLRTVTAESSERQVLRAVYAGPSTRRALVSPHPLHSALCGGHGACHR